MIKDLLQQSNPDLSGLIKGWLHPSIRLRTDVLRLEDLALGASRIGGLPDLPSTMPWPTWQEQPLAFLAQLDCADIASFDIEHLLPSEGTLAFFYDGIYDLFDLKSKDPQRWQVLYWPTNTEIARQQPSTTLMEIYRTCAVTPTLEWTLPSIDSDELAEVGITWDRMYGPNATAEIRATSEEYMNICHKLHQHYAPNRETHRCLGYPDPVQGYLGQRSLRLLLQIDSDENTNMTWGDVGRIYFMLDETMLQAHRFDQAIVHSQCS